MLLVDQMRQQVKRLLLEDGISAEVFAQPVPPTKLYRLYVISDAFENMSHTERQEVVWRAVDTFFRQQTRVPISTILTLTMDEVSDDEVPKDMREFRSVLKRRGERR